MTVLIFPSKNTKRKPKLCLGMGEVITCSVKTELPISPRVNSLVGEVDFCSEQWQKFKTPVIRAEIRTKRLLTTHALDLLHFAFVNSQIF